MASYALKINIDGDPEPLALPGTSANGEATDNADGNASDGNSGGGASVVEDAAAESDAESDAEAAVVRVTKTEKKDKSGASSSSGSWYLPSKGPIADAIGYVWPSSAKKAAGEGGDGGGGQELSAHEQQLVAASKDTDAAKIDDGTDADAGTAAAAAVQAVGVELEVVEEGGEGEDDEATPFQTWVLRGGMCFVATSISLAMLTFGVVVPRRYTHTMTILKDAKTVRIGTYKLVGERSFEVRRNTHPHTQPPTHPRPSTRPPARALSL